MTRSGLILTLTIAIQSIFLWIGCGQLSPTPDEFAHLAAGIEYWHTGSLDLYNVNPPLTKLWISLPAVFEGAIVPTIPFDERYNLDARYEFTRGNLLAAAWKAIAFPCRRSKHSRASCGTALRILFNR